MGHGGGHLEFKFQLYYASAAEPWGYASGKEG